MAEDPQAFMANLPMQELITGDGVGLRYIDTDVDGEEKGLLILLHGFTGSSRVWSRNIQALASKYRVIVPDLRGHGQSDKPRHGYHVARLALDLQELVDAVASPMATDPPTRWSAIGGSLGCSILWCYAELFGTDTFSRMILVDQSPLQDSTLDGWDSRFCNRGMNNASAVAALQTTLALQPEVAHKGTIAACLSYRSHPLPSDNTGLSEAQVSERLLTDEAFFLAEALKGNSRWYGKLMADHTALDWRDSITANFGVESGSGSTTKILVVASERSGCFPAAGPMAVVDLVNGKEAGVNPLAKGVVIDWGGHWCYWENPEKFNDLVLSFLDE